MDLKYGDKIIEMEGVIVEVSDGAVAIDFKGRLGYLRIPRRMIISDYELKVGQEVGLNMSFVEVLSDKINEKYVSNLEIQKRRGIEPENRWK
ncbi:hypothetical protein EXM98_17950 [Clostridium botulinum]|uniref:CBO2463/CBO2479 domain-containing protein n=1 Tax=Clostridium botulinum TaxID=1491 RepID=UPI0005F9A6B2|nr:CBO2463/CBO2479 domain-containing protein [Clostridium botulinum]KEI87785.1 hypothetical protein N492_12710 [Clostridium botulinum B2 267]MBY6800245.1 hypothetical protein [Clostridium botulinum]MBY6998034.1 hypothetical protein [Clostridium botulinum]MBY7010291.1 hypothetical protein [Clostridium botulinum]MCR1156430.1 hypothetical protein [Clostridium botulinum]